jgi:hypothetical protein
MRTLSLTLAILASGTAAWASDQPDYGSGDVLHPEYFGGMRFDVGTAPGIHKVTTSQSHDADGNPDPQADGASDLTAKQGYAAGVSVYWDHSLDGGFGWVMSPGLFYRNVVGKSNEYRDTFVAAGFELAGGVAYTIDHLNLELQPYVGFAGCNLKQDANFNGFTGSRSTGTGNDLTYGMKLSANWLFQSNCYLGLTGGYERFIAQCTGIYQQSPSGLIWDSQKIEVQGSGIMGTVTLGFWF